MSSSRPHPTRVPPPVVVDLKPEPVWFGVSSLLKALSLATFLVWVFLQAPRWGGAESWPGEGACAADDLAAWIAVGAVSMGWSVWADWRAWRDRGRGDLRCLAWTGQRWQLTRHRGETAEPATPTGLEAQGCEPRVMLDLGDWMLLRLGVHTRACGPDWVAVSARLVGPQWHGLRVALHGASRHAPERATLHT